MKQTSRILIPAPPWKRDSQGTRTRRPGLPDSLSDKINGAIGSLWSEYADKRPSEVRTEVRGNVITCRLIDAVGNFNKSMAAPQTHETVRGGAGLTAAGYKRDAVAAVVGLTRQRVTSFLSSHDRDTDVATEIFTLEPSLQNGRPKGRSGAITSW
jgi:hypothetical protein